MNEIDINYKMFTGCPFIFPNQDKRRSLDITELSTIAT